MSYCSKLSPAEALSKSKLADPAGSPQHLWSKRGLLVFCSNLFLIPTMYVLMYLSCNALSCMSVFVHLMLYV